MRRPVKRVFRALALAGIGALVLAGCGSGAKAIAGPLTVRGTPATSIAVPLSGVGCTANDVCVAVGSSSANLGAPAEGEVSTPRGRWLNLAVPPSPSPLFTSSACAGTQCLFAGSEPGRDLLWSFSTTDGALTAATPPTGGIGVDALSCSRTYCALVDTAANGTLRFVSSTDAGGTWSAPIALSWAKGDAVTSLSCSGVATCVLSAVTSRSTVSLEVTANAGATWQARPTTGSWSTLGSIHCYRVDCVAVATVANTSSLVRTKNLFVRVTVVALGHLANALACTTVLSCVAVGQDANGAAWLATIARDTASPAVLRYVPTPLLDVACGSALCAATGVTTLVSVPVAPSS